MSMVGETIWVKLKGRPVKMIITESRLVYEPPRRGFDLVLRGPNGAIFYEGFLPMGKQQLQRMCVRAPASTRT